MKFLFYSTCTSLNDIIFRDTEHCKTLETSVQFGQNAIPTVFFSFILQFSINGVAVFIPV